MKLFIRLVFTALALFATVVLVPGIRVDDPNAWTIYALMAVILSVVNTLVRPILKMLSCPLILLTLGIFLLVINGLTFWIAALIAESLGVGFYVDNYWAAFLGALIVSIVTVVLNAFIKDDDRA